MKILLIAGHGAGQPGAVANGYVEADLTRELVNLIAPKLRVYANVDIYDQNKNAFQEVQKGAFNVKGYDYVLEVHFNAGGGTGSEIYVTSSEKGKSVETTIVNEMSKYFKNRGVKVKDFLVIKTAKDRGVSSSLLETCFIDNAKDMNTYVNNKNSIVECIVKGIVSGFGLKANNNEVFSEPIPQPKPNGEVVDQILHVGSKVQLNGIYKIHGVSAKLNGVICRELVGTPPYQNYHYIDAEPCYEVDKYGNKTKDQICDVNHYLKIPGTFTVLAIDKKTDSCKIKIGSREVWVYCGPCTEV